MIHFPKKPWFIRLCSTSLLRNTVRKGEIARINKQFAPFPSVFYPIRELSSIFIKFEIVVCKPFQFGRSLKFVVWQGVKIYHNVSDTVHGIYLQRKWRRYSASSPQIFPKKRIFPQKTNFSPRNQFSLLWYKVLLRDFVNRPTSRPKDRLQSQPRCMSLIFSLFNMSHLSSRFTENCHWLASFVSYIHSCAEFSKHALGIIRITLYPSIPYSVLSVRKRGNYQCLPACKFNKVSLYQCSQWNFNSGVLYPLLLKNGGIRNKIGVQNRRTRINTRSYW